MIFAFDEEAERSVPVTDEDVERGRLEDGWVIHVNYERIETEAETEAVAELCSAGETWHLFHVSDGTWAFHARPFGVFRANKVRLATDDVVCARMRKSDMQPGMVYMSQPRSPLHILVSDQQTRNHGDGDTLMPWRASHNPNGLALVCCTRASMQFILK